MEFTGHEITPQVSQCSIWYANISGCCQGLCFVHKLRQINRVKGSESDLYSFTKRSGKPAAISHRAVREIGVSRHHRALIEAHSKAPSTSQHYYVEGFKGGLMWSPIMPTDAIPSDGGCKILQAEE